MRAACSSASFCQPSSRIASASSPSNARCATRASWRSRPIGQSSVPSARVPSSQAPYSSTATFAPAAARSRRRCSAGASAAAPAATNSSSSSGSSAARFELDPLPATDLRDRRPGLRLLEVGGDGLEPAGDGGQPLRERGVVAREQEEQAVTDRVERERSSLPDPQDLGVEDGAADVVELELALERARRRELARVDRLDRASGGRCSAATRRGRRRGSPSPSWSSASCRPSQVARIGSRSIIRRKRASTRS